MSFDVGYTFKFPRDTKRFLKFLAVVVAERPLNYHYEVANVSDSTKKYSSLEFTIWGR